MFRPVSDAAYNNIHQWTAETTADSREQWARAAEKLAALNPAHVIAGHKDPDRDDSPDINVFTDSAPSRPLLIHGMTRAGRPDAEKAQLAKSISTASSEVTGVPESRILVIITDSPARFAVEGGRVLPEPGDEDDWLNEQSN